MRKFLVGSILTYAGLALFLLGFIVSTVSIPAFDTMIVALMPLGGMGGVLVGVVIQILSGIVGVTGLLLCVASVSKPVPAPVTIIQQVPVPTPPPAPIPVRAPTSTITPAQSSTCKYCGHYIQPSEFFCPSCNRAQR